MKKVKISCAGCGKQIEMFQCRYDSKKYKVFACSASCRLSSDFLAAMNGVLVSERGYPFGFHAREEYERHVHADEEVDKFCVVCGMAFKGKRKGPDTCGESCAELSRLKKIADTKLSRFGHRAFNNPKKGMGTKRKRYGTETYNNRVKAAATCKKIYGVDNPSKNDVVIARIRSSTMARFGVDNYFKDRNLVALAWQEKLGCDNPQKNPEINQRTMATRSSRYELAGACPRESTEETCLRKYGAKTFFGSDDGRITRETLIEKHGHTEQEVDDIFAKKDSMSIDWATRRTDGDIEAAIEMAKDRVESVTVPFGRASKKSLEFLLPLKAELIRLGVDVSDIMLGIDGSRELRLFDRETRHLYMYDFTVVSRKAIVEFNGSMWHAKSESDVLPFRSAAEVMKRDSDKKRHAEKLGFKVIVVWDRDIDSTTVSKTASEILNRRECE